MEVLEKLKHLQLVSKILMELESHLGLSEKDLAEFLISQAEGCRDAKEFHAKLASEDEFPEQLSERLYKFIRLMSKKPYVKGCSLSDFLQRHQERS